MSAMADPKPETEIITKTTAGILTIRMNRPEKKNALNTGMYSAMAEALVQARTEDPVRVILITGSGGSFTSGNDVLDFMNAPPEGENSPVIKFLSNLAACEKPVIAAVNGLAIGIGTTMLLHCDMAYAAESARFRLPFVNLGLCPEAGSSLLLPLFAGYRRAAELLLLGDFFDAQTALESGIVNAVYPDDTLESRVREHAGQLVKQPPAALRTAKKLMKQGVQRHLREQMEAEYADFKERLRAPEFAEAVQALFQKREPDFSNFT
jgi:enoyl-CoA hydratase/carnithine racemase